MKTYRREAGQWDWTNLDELVYVVGWTVAVLTVTVGTALLIVGAWICVYDMLVQLIWLWR